MLVPHGEGGRGMEKSKFDGMFRGHMAQSYGELEATNGGE